MPLYIRFVCENKDCKLAVGPFTFDQLTETYLDLINAARGDGWTFEMDEKNQPKRVICSHCRSPQ